MSARAHKITRRKIRCTHLIPTLGYGKWEAVRGDWITYKEHRNDGSYHSRYARVVGWVIAPAEGPTVDAFDGVCVVALSDDATFCYERWIRTEDITSIHPPAPKFLQYFASADPEELIAASEYGAASASHTDWTDASLPCGYPGCTADHLHTADGTPKR